MAEGGRLCRTITSPRFPPASRLPALSEDALALQFSTKHAAELRYVAEWNKWFRWNGTKWEPDKTVHIFDLVRDLCRSVAVRVEGTAAKGVASHHTVAAVASLARSDRRHAALPSSGTLAPGCSIRPAGQLTCALATSGRTIREDYLTKSTAVAPAPGPCPLWLQFLSRVFDEDEQLIGFVQRMLGYAPDRHHPRARDVLFLRPGRQR